ncbi:MAG: hypothetical protein HY827_01765 [Actinobacteria bacterium]|nr:hypothetical protein [Actinomycetota bacterium]
MLDLDVFQENGRGSSIESFDFLKRNGVAVAYMRGPQAIAAHLESVYRRRGLRERRLTEGEHPRWTHSFVVPEVIVDGVERAMSFFSEILIIPSEPPLKSLIALGFYKAPRPGQPAMEWENAPAGALVNRAKYQRDDAAFSELVDALTRVIRRHPWYAFFGEMVVSVPGHRADVRSFGERIAAAVALAIDRPLLPISAVTRVRPEAKSASRAEMDLSHQFVVDGEVAGKVVILIDDVYMTGRTMKNAAAALSDSGARLVLGLVAARTMKAS